MGYLGWDLNSHELSTLISKDADDVKLIHETTQKGKKEIDKLFDK